MGQRFRRIRWTCDAVLATCAVFAVTAPVAAQTPGGSPDLSVERHGIIIGGGPGPAPTFERCVEVEIGRDSSFGCLNQKLRREVDRINPSINLPPIDARSPDVRVGNVNEAAVRQQYGSNYGRSAFPYRPPAPNLVLPRR
jgi:hypothetical protein